MLQEDTLRIVEEIESLWQRWNPSDEERMIWRETIKDRSYVSVKAALVRFYRFTGGKRLQPVLADFLEILKDWRSETRQTDILAHKRFYISFICQRLDEKGRGNVGNIEICEWMAKQNQQGDWMVPAQDSLDNYCQECNRTKGGHWIVIVGHNDLDAKNMAREFRHEAGLCDPDTCFVCKHENKTCGMFCYYCYQERIETGQTHSVNTILAKFSRQPKTATKRQAQPIGTLLADTLKPGETTEGEEVLAANPDSYDPNSQMKQDEIPF